MRTRLPGTILLAALAAGCGGSTSGDQMMVVEGRLSVRIEDRADGSVGTHYAVEADGVEWSLRLPEPSAADLVSGVRVTVRGTAEDGELVVADPGDLEISTEEAAVTAAAPVAERIVVIPLNIGSAAIRTCTRTVINGLMFGPGDTVEEFYRRNSLNAITFDDRSKAVDPISIADQPCQGDSVWTDCLGVWASVADTAYQQLYGDLALFNRKIYILPGQFAGDFGEYSVPGGSSRAWVYDACNSAPKYFFTHEFGHNLGMKHAAGPLSDGTIADYGDNGDVMGSGTFTPRFNAPHLIKMGWIDPARVTAANLAGSYTLAPFDRDDDPTTLPQIAIIEAVSPDYYVSYRRAIGLSPILFVGYADHVLVHSAFHGFPNSWETDVQAALGVGETFQHGGVQVTVIAIGTDGSSATVQIVPAPNQPPEGEVVAANTNVVKGWAYDGDAGAAPIPVEIWVKSPGDTAFTLRATVTADTHLPQAPVGHPGHTDDHGFKWQHTLPPGTHQVRVYAVNVLGGIPAGAKVQLGGTYTITMN